MSVLTINNSNSSLEWSKFHSLTKKKENGSLANLKETSFVSDFPSPNDEIAKKAQPSSDPQKNEKKKKPFSYTSENWIG